MGFLCLQVTILIQAQCPPIAGTDTLLCGFTATLMATPEGGTWSIVCDESVGVVEFEDANSTETSVTVSECGVYTFVYTMDTPECAAEDTVKVGFEDPSDNVVSGGLEIGLEVDYGCPGGGSADCSNTITIAGTGPPTFDWSLDLLQECCPMLYETIVENPLSDCEAQNIAVNILTPDECTVSEANWSGGQGDLVNVDSVVVTANFFDIFLPLLGDLGSCGAIGGECSFEGLGDVCQSDTLGFVADTLIVEIPYSTGAGRWHYVVSADSSLALQDTTQLPPPYNFATLIIQPNAQYAGPNSVTFSAWETIGGNLVELFSQPLELNNRIQWVYQIDYVNDTLITFHPICENGDCNCGCGQSSFFPSIDIPILDLSCPPISLSFMPPGFGEVFAFYPNTVFCEDENSVTPFIDVFGCGIDYLFSGSDGLSIDSFTGEIFIDQSQVGTHEVYFSSSNGEFFVTVIDILPIEMIEFDLPPSFETCEGNGDMVQPTLLGGSSFGGTWAMSGSGVIDSSTGTIDIDASGSGVFTITYTPNSPCVVTTSQDIEITVNSLSPSITVNCSSTIDAVLFDWSPIEGADGYDISYSINGGNSVFSNTNSTNFEITGLLPSDFVTLSVVAFGSAICGQNAEGVSTCNVADCPPLVIEINNFNPFYCSDIASFELTATPAGGIFFGNGVENNTFFNPAAAGVGIHTIQYAYTDFNNGCSYAESATIEVFAPLEAVLVECGEITDNSITFSWSASTNAIEYQVVLSGAMTDNFTQTATTYTVENLTATDEVSIEVTAIGAVECANSEAAMATCSVPLVEKCLDFAGLNQILSFPTAFSPNEDGLNDSFHPVFPYAFADYELMVFNRWGKQVFGSQDVDAAWNGVALNTGKEAALGVYVWHLKATVVNECGEEVSLERKGNVSLVR